MDFQSAMETFAEAWVAANTQTPLTEAAETQQELLKLLRKNKETIHRHYVGYIEKQCDDRWLVRFARHVEGKWFEWPERENVSIIDEGQIEKTLNLPDFTYRNDRVISFSFNHFRDGGMFMKPLNFNSQTPHWHQHFCKIFSIYCESEIYPFSYF